MKKYDPPLTKFEGPYKAPKQLEKVLEKAFNSQAGASQAGSQAPGRGLSGRAGHEENCWAPA